MHPTASPQTPPVLFIFTEAIGFNSTVITYQFSSRTEVYYISYWTENGFYQVAAALQLTDKRVKGKYFKRLYLSLRAAESKATVGWEKQC